MMVTGSEIRRVREALGEHQAQFGARFGVHRRTIIRWEQSTGTNFSEWGGWRTMANGESVQRTQADVWREAVAHADKKLALRKNSKRKRATALATRKSRSARRRKSARKAVAVKRRRGGVARRRSVAKAKRIKKPGRKK